MCTQQIKEAKSEKVGMKSQLLVKRQGKIQKHSNVEWEFHEAKKSGVHNLSSFEGYSGNGAASSSYR